MIVDNHLQVPSFQYDYENDSNYIGNREEELLDLFDISECCRTNGEKLQCSLEDFYQAEVEPEVYLCDWLFANTGSGSHDARELLLRMLDMLEEYEDAGDQKIRISLGEAEGCAGTKKEYDMKRRSILAGLRDAGEFCDFMKSCYHESVFSDNVKTAMKKIPDLEQHTEEIAFNLSLLNDYAIEIYKRHQYNAAGAMKELKSRAMECTGDPAHKEYLKFPFTYDLEQWNLEQQQEMIVEIECSPHMKLIRPDSDLRIYFYWCHDRVGRGEKVLIGRIGSHPYEK